LPTEVAALRGSRWVLALSLALIVIGVIASLSWSDDDAPSADTSALAPTSTSLRTEVKGIVVDNTTTTAAVAPVTTTTTKPATGAVTTTTTISAKAGRVWGYSYPSQPDDETFVSLSQEGNVVAKAKTDDNGFYDFPQVAPGTYTLSRTSTTTTCSTTTTADEKPTCTSASSAAIGPTITLSPGGEVRADVF
jgi:hypothetical protein